MSPFVQCRVLRAFGTRRTGRIRNSIKYDTYGWIIGLRASRSSGSHRTPVYLEGPETGGEALDEPASHVLGWALDKEELTADIGCV